MILLGTKIGMTRVLQPSGASIPVTVIQAGPCVVTQIKTAEKEGYDAVQVAYGDMKARNSTMPMIGHDAKAGSAPKRHHREFRISGDQIGKFSVGQTIGVSDLVGTMYVDVVGQSKGKGFAGTMKRHNFKGMSASHGTERKHRAPGSIGSYGSNRGFGGGLLKGKRMAGHMGDERVTVRSLDVIRIDPERNLLLVKGPVPGANTGTLEIRPSVRLYKSKAKKLAAAGK
jgi:large subunit ribosomal protein L3